MHPPGALADRCICRRSVVNKWEQIATWPRIFANRRRYKGRSRDCSIIIISGRNNFRLCNNFRGSRRLSGNNFSSRTRLLIKKNDLATRILKPWSPLPTINSFDWLNRDTSPASVRNRRRSKCMTLAGSGKHSWACTTCIHYLNTIERTNLARRFKNRSSIHCHRNSKCIFHSGNYKLVSFIISSNPISEDFKSILRVWLKKRSIMEKYVGRSISIQLLCNRCNRDNAKPCLRRVRVHSAHKEFHSTNHSPKDRSASTNKILFNKNRVIGRAGLVRHLAQTKN